MSELFCWPTVIVGMGPPSVNDDPAAPGCGPGPGGSLQVGTEITLTLRAARRTRATPGRVYWSAAWTADPQRRPGTTRVRCARRNVTLSHDQRGSRRGTRVNVIRGKRQHAQAERADGAGGGTLSRRGVLGGLAAVPIVLSG